MTIEAMMGAPIAALPPEQKAAGPSSEPAEKESALERRERFDLRLLLCLLCFERRRFSRCLPLDPSAEPRP